jgi:hypothetical protein
MEEAKQWFVPRLGTMQQTRPEGVFQIAAGNLNCASTKEVQDRKISDIHGILETWVVQGGGFSKVGINWRNLLHAQGPASWFRTGQDEYRASAVHNRTERVTTTPRQQGGISIFAGKEVRQYITCGVEDFRKLGRWHSWIIQADPSHRTPVWSLLTRCSTPSRKARRQSINNTTGICNIRDSWVLHASYSSLTF